MGNRSQQVGPQPFPLRLQRDFLFFIPQSPAFQNKAAFIQNRNHQVFLENLQRRIILCRNANHAHYFLVSPDREIQIMRMRERICGRARMLVILYYPVCNPFFFRRHCTELFVCFALRRYLKRKLLSFHRQSVEHRPIQECTHLLCRDLNDLLLITPLLKLLIAVDQQFHIICLLGRLARLLFNPCGQCIGNHTGHQHDQKRDRVIRIVCCQCEARYRKEEVERDNTEQRCQRAIEMSVCPDCRQQNAQDIYRNDICFSQPQCIEAKTDSGGRRRNQNDLHQICPAEFMIFYMNEG